MKTMRIIGLLATVAVAIALLPFTSQPAYADDPIIVNSLDGTATPTVKSIAVPYALPQVSDVKFEGTDPVFKTIDSSDATWHYKQSDGTWAIMPSDQQFLEGTYRYQVCVLCPDENFTFADDAVLFIDEETWTMIKKEKRSDGIEYALFASPEINLPDEKLDSPGPLKRTGGTSHDYGISWTKVDKAKGYEITVKNTTQGFAPKEKTFEVDASKNTYDLKDVFKSLSIRTGHNTFIITVKALAPAGYRDSDLASSPTYVGSQWGFEIEQHLNLSVDPSTGIASWDSYPFDEAQYYYYRLVYGATDGKQIVDGYFEKSKTTFSFDTNIEYFHGETGKYYLYVIAMDNTRPNGGFELTEQDYVEYNYMPKVKTISVNGVKQPMEGDLAQAYVGNYSVEEEHLSLPEPGYGSAYWRCLEGGSWVEMGPTEKFEASGQYRVSIPLHYDEGFALVPTPTVKVNGKEVEYVLDIFESTRTARIECRMDVIALSDNLYVVTAGALNVRADASTSSERVGGLSYGDVVQATGQMNGWTQLEFDGQTAWVNTSYLALTYSEETAIDPIKYTIKCGAINVRSTPVQDPTNANRIGGYTYGKEVLVTGRLKDTNGDVWLVVDYEGGGDHQLGFMMEKYTYSESAPDTDPPLVDPAKEDEPADELVIDTGKYPKVSFAPYSKSAIATGDKSGLTAALTDENYINNDDGYLTTTIYPEDALNFYGLTKDKVKLPTVFTDLDMVVLDLSKNGDGSITLKLGPVAYEFTVGAGASWTKGSTEGFSFTVNRNVDDNLTYGLFTGISVDGIAVDASNYIASEGSLNGVLSAAYLEGLSAGTHAITVSFEDGAAETTLTISEAADNGDDNESSDNADDKGAKNSTAIPSTGDSLPVAGFAASLVVSLLAMVGALAYRRRSHR